MALLFIEYSLLLVHLNQGIGVNEEVLIVSFQGEIVCIHNCAANVYDTAERIKHGPYANGARPHGRSCWGGSAGVWGGGGGGQLKQTKLKDVF